MFLGIDLGTSNVKAVVVDCQGQAHGEATIPVDRVVRPGGAVEQNIDEIWSAACRAIQAATSAIDSKEIQSLGVSSQGGALQLLDAYDRPLGPVISWLDGRGAPYDEAFSQRWGDDFLVEHLGRTPCAISPGQLMRLRAEEPELLANAAGIGFVGDVIVGRLAGRRAHDCSSLSIAMLLNPRLGRADPVVLAELGLPEERFPAILPATQAAGCLSPSAAEATGLPPGIPVSPAVHDQYTALLGAGAVRPGDVSLGTGSAWVLVVNSADYAPPVIRGAFVCPHPIGKMFGQLISMGNGGSAVGWAMQMVGWPVFSAEDVDAMIGGIGAGSDGLCFWPLLAAGATLAGPIQGGRLTGIGFNHTARHVVRAVVEGLACELARYVGLGEAAGVNFRRLVLSGGAAASKYSPQIIADVTGRPVACCRHPAASARGAAVLARALAEPNADLAELAGDWAAVSAEIEPGRNRAAYVILLERYLELFDPQGNVR